MPKKKYIKKIAKSSLTVMMDTDVLICFLNQSVLGGLFLLTVLV